MCQDKFGPALPSQPNSLNQFGIRERRKIGGNRDVFKSGSVFSMTVCTFQRDYPFPENVRAQPQIATLGERQISGYRRKPGLTPCG